ncbi:hypothetical protein G7054_g5052 [Neopestalotiopsis clavispora]|nr:hypothetical protein G7054_g5052 [Neopestalotiopsis clavispora]
MTLQPNGRCSRESPGPRRRIQQHRRRNRRDRQDPYTRRQESSDTSGQAAAVSNGSTTVVREPVPEQDTLEASIASISLDERTTAEDQNEPQTSDSSARLPQGEMAAASLSAQAMATAQFSYDPQAQSAALDTWITTPMSQDAWNPLGGRST